MSESNFDNAALRETYLVQRLERPWGEAANPFSFGGGLRNGGLQKEAMALLKGIFTFDYMGSAEFEFGAVPKALTAIYKVAVEGGLMSGTVLLTEASVAKVTTWDRSRRQLPLKADPIVYFICPSAWEGEIVHRIIALAGGKGRLKEGTRLANVLRPDPAHEDRVAGWLELDNGWFFFTDREMFEKVAALFEVKVAV